MSNTQINREGSSIAVGAEVRILGFDLCAAITKSGEKFQTLVMPDAVVSGEDVTIAEMIANINTTLGTNIKEDQFSDIIKYIGMKDLSKVRMRLNQAFAYYEGKQDDADQTNSTEYAFSISILYDDPLEKNAGIFVIKSLSFAIWNSSRKAVIEKMNLGTVEEMLKNLDKPGKKEAELPSK